MRRRITTTVVCGCALSLVIGQTPASAAVLGTARWTQLSPATHPGARYYSAMAYDGSHNLVLFGGYNDATGFLSDTWVWDGTAWTNKNPAHHPSARDGAAMVYDSASNSVILFGGEDGTAFADTWSWDGIDWTQRTPVQSAPRRAWAGMSISPVTSAPILFGGLDSTGLSDTWTWENANNKWASVTTAHHPAARSDFAITYDSVRNKVVVFGGGLWSGTNLTAEYGDTWTFDGTDWTQAATTGPHGRINPHAAFDPRLGGVVLFGGFDDGAQAYYQDTWLWNGTTWAAQSVAASVTKRDSGVMAYLPPAGKTVLFGGFGSTGSNLADTWVLTLSAVTSVPLPSTKTSASKSFLVSWGAPGLPVNYTVQYAIRTRNSAGAWVTGAWQSWQFAGPTTHSASFTGVAGTTYQFRALANYQGGATSGYSAAVTSVVPLDERSTSAVFSAGWTRRAAAGRYLSTMTDTSLAAKTMSIRTAAHAFYLVGDKCTGCGKFSVYVDGKLVATIDSHAASTLLRQTLYTRVFTGTATHTLLIKTLGTAGRPRVAIDAIGVQR
jgi:hypothetical protein